MVKPFLPDNESPESNPGLYNISTFIQCVCACVIKMLRLCGERGLILYFGFLRVW